MKESQSYIERIRQINKDIQHLEVPIPGISSQVKPGHSLLVRIIDADHTSNGWHPYLRERWWPVGVENGDRLVIERPGNIRYQPGQVLSMLHPIGQPFRFRRSLRNILLMAYNTPPTPMMMMIPALLKNNISVTLVLLGDTVKYNTQHIDEEVEIIHADEEMVWKDQVMTLGWADQIFVAVGQENEMVYFREIMEMIEKRRASIPKNYVFGVFRPTPACGVGACSACMIRLRQSTKLSCTEGPALDLTLVRL